MKISLITVTYNRASTLSGAIESVLSQTHSDIEYIIVDGASTDGTINIIEEYNKKFKGRLKWISEPDKGIYDAMNKGIAMSTGDVIGILNSDDFFTSNDVLETVSKAFNDDITLDAVYADIHFVDPSDLDKVTRYYSSRYFRKWSAHFGLMPAHPSLYIRKSIFDKYGCYKTDYKITADLDLIYRFICKFEIKTKYIKKDFVTMRSGGVSTQSLKNRHILNKETLRACKENNIYSNYPFMIIKYGIKIIEQILDKLR
ncbi:MAG: glycosyltransferase family 2 protein [Marinifilaceae bacterium]